MEVVMAEMVVEEENQDIEDDNESRVVFLWVHGWFKADWSVYDELDVWKVWENDGPAIRHLSRLYTSMIPISIYTNDFLGNPQRCRWIVDKLARFLHPRRLHSIDMALLPSTPLLNPRKTLWTQSRSWPAEFSKTIPVELRGLDPETSTCSPFPTHLLSPTTQKLLARSPGWLPVPPPHCLKIHQEPDLTTHFLSDTADHQLFFCDHPALGLIWSFSTPNPTSTIPPIKTVINANRGGLKGHVDLQWRFRPRTWVDGLWGNEGVAK